MSLLNFNFVIIHIIHQMLALFKNSLNYLKDSIFKCFFKEYNRLTFFKKSYFFLEEESIMKEIFLKD